MLCQSYWRLAAPAFSLDWETAHLDIHITAQADLANVITGAAKAILSTNNTTSILIVMVVHSCHERFGHQRFACAPPPLAQHLHEPPEAKAAALPRRRFVCVLCSTGRRRFVFVLCSTSFRLRRLLVLCVFEAGAFALVRVVEGVAHARVRCKVPAVACSFCDELISCGHGAVCSSEALHRTILRDDIQVRVVHPASLAAMLCSTGVQRLWSMPTGIQIRIAIIVPRYEV